MEDRSVTTASGEDGLSEAAADTSAIGRRRMLWGAGLMAGAAGAALLVPTTSAEAADGDPVELGQTNAAASTTTLRIAGTAGSDQPVLALNNAHGPALSLKPVDASYDSPLAVGEIVSRATGPMIGVDPGSGVENTYLALGSDLAVIPMPIAFDPVRILDTRRAGASPTIIRASKGVFDDQHRLVDGAWIDLGLIPATEAFSLQGAFINLTVTGAVGNGFLTVCRPDLGARPEASSVNFAAGRTVVNSGFFLTGRAEEYYALRIYIRGTAHVIVDLTGYTLLQQAGVLAPPQLKKVAHTSRLRPHRDLARNVVLGTERER